MERCYSMLLNLLLGLLIVSMSITSAFSCQKDSSIAKIVKTFDFEITGNGNSNNWDKADWIVLTKQESSSEKKISTQVKLLYSDRGMYFLFDCEDERITATLEADFAPLFKEDVVEVFLWPDQSVPIYFEYELSPLNYELPILIPNINGRIHGWRPMRYEGSNKVQHATSTQGGEKKSHATIKGWTAEFFIPFTLLRPLIGEAPKSGNQWRANLYRIDYDEGYNTWTWQKTSKGKPGNFHEYEKFGTFVFE